MLNEVVAVVDAVDVDAWVGGSRSSLVDGVVGVILMWISLFFVLIIAVNLDVGGGVEVDGGVDVDGEVDVDGVVITF